ncbi:hypothetical protein KK2020170_15080 [Flavobacterium okayamense]|uniref:Uncharacterized protein n=1 Tax=Flavobacterium okayamense TaxID=2830782 RepID=A0ABM7SD12_9FLAO|nr:hypothetical protein KK2020170_15080 [Flavobacterium okayamense]
MLIKPNKAINPNKIKLIVESVKKTAFAFSSVHNGKTNGNTAEAITHIKMYIVCIL